MKILWQIGLILGVCFIGEGISLLLPIPFPASVISMIIIFILLLTRLLKPHQIKESSDFLKHIMSLLFVPAGVGVMQVYGNIRGSLLPLVAICIISTVITFTVTAYTVKGVIHIQERFRRHREQSLKNSIQENI